MSAARRLADVACSALVLPVALALALAERRRRRERPRVVFGTTPIINTKYWSRALRSRGYDAASYAYTTYAINDPGDFDHTPERLFPRLSRLGPLRILRKYLVFLWALRRFDVFVLDYDGGFLRRTPLERLDFPLLALAGKRIVAIPYGADAIDIRRCPHEPTRVALLRDYPELDSIAGEVAARVRRYDRWAAYVVCGSNMVDYLPRYDLLLPSGLAIDTEEWDAPPRPPSDGPVRVLHAPNHPAVKGTQHVVVACEALRAEGLPVELVLRQGVPNREIRRLMAEEVDVVASAFVMGYYELFALEGMSMRLPVLNYWRPDLKQLLFERTFASECPIVDTPPERLKDNLRMLVEDPELRRRLGEEGRRYVERHYSNQAVGALLDEIVSGVWTAAARRRPDGAALGSRAT